LVKLMSAMVKLMSAMVKLMSAMVKLMNAFVKLIELSDSHRRVFVLREQRGLPWDEVAQVMGMNRDTAVGVLRQATKALREILNRKAAARREEEEESDVVRGSR